MAARPAEDPRQRLRVRRALEAAIEEAIAALDALDGDPDLEEQCEDEGAQCDAEESTWSSPAWEIDGWPMYEVDGPYADRPRGPWDRRCPLRPDKQPMPPRAPA